MTKKYYFIGICGISMSSLAVFTKLQGNSVSGSDLSENETASFLKQFDISYNLGHDERNIKKFKPNIVVINNAIHNDNCEYVWAKNNKVKIMSRSDLLGELSHKFKNVIAISGTHGKTTTTALLSEIFIDANLKPTIHIGGIMKKNGSNFLIGKKKYFITEACEYKNSFHSLQPTIGAVLNIEPDHLDFFKNMAEIEQSFKDFLDKSKIKIYPKDSATFTLKTPEKTINYSITNIQKHEKGYSFCLKENDTTLCKLQTNFLGEHNIKNVAVAVIIAHYYKIKMQIIKKSIKNYHGVKRRFEKINKIKSTTIIHDYAHHPTEIKKTILQAQNYGKVLTIFQPHTYSRTKNLFKEFTSAFNESDGLILVPTYPARETESMGVTSHQLFMNICNSVQNKKQEFSQNNPNSTINLKTIMYCENFESCNNKIIQNLTKFDCILILGAGNINDLTALLAKI